MKKTLTSTIFAMIITTHQLIACTGIQLTATDGSVVNGRTVEFGAVLDMYAAVVPKNFTFKGKTPNGEGLTYTSKYASAGIYCFDYQVLMDGVNEKGLSAAAFYFPGYAQYASITKENQSKGLSPVEFPNWILSQFATVDEVKAGLSSVLIAPTVVESWGPVPAPFHYVVYDSAGKSLVIEPLDGKLVTYDNLIGSFTNSPTFDWHTTNLRNFINLTPFNVSAIDLKGLKLAPFGQGSGMVGLPGDFTPPSRFVRASIFSATAEPSANSAETVNQTFHILNQFDIPVGVAKQKNGSQTATDYTQLTSVKDPKSQKYYFRSYDDQTIKFIDLHQFDLNAKTIKSTKTTGSQPTVDISSNLN